MVDVSIIIVNLNTRDLLQACLESVFGERGPAVEVIVIDNGSTDGSVEMVRGKFPLTRLVVNERNEGFARPNNVGMRMASGKYLLLLNSDTVVESGAIRTLASFLDEHGDAGACGPRLAYPDGRLQRSVKGFPTIWTHFCDMFFLDKLFPQTRLFGRGEQAYFNYGEMQEVDHVMAAAFLVRKDVLMTVGYLDVRFNIYYNDMDWCYRIKQKGWKIFFVPGAVVVHHLGQTIGRLNLDFGYFKELYENVMLFYQKNYGRASVVVYKILLVAGFLLRAPAWTVYSFLQPSEHAVTMRRFCWKTLALGIRFWAPLNISHYYDERSEKDLVEV